MKHEQALLIFEGEEEQGARNVVMDFVIVGVGVRVLSQVVPFNEDCMIQRLPLRRTLAYAADSSGPSLPFGN